MSISLYHVSSLSSCVSLQQQAYIKSSTADAAARQGLGGLQGEWAGRAAACSVAPYITMQQPSVLVTAESKCASWFLATRTPSSCISAILIPQRVPIFTLAGGLLVGFAVGAVAIVTLLGAKAPGPETLQSVSVLGLLSMTLSQERMPYSQM